jgi:predicted enzyme related to lactoylglutathione lyase
VPLRQLELVMKNALNWFEIAVRDMDRAAAFYETILDGKVRREIFGGLPYGLLPYSEPGVGGALVADARRTPGDGGTLVYLNANGQLDAILARAAKVNAAVVLPKTAIGPDGFIAIIVDSEGNRVGFNSAS